MFVLSIELLVLLMVFFCSSVSSLPTHCVTSVGSEQWSKILLSITHSRSSYVAQLILVGSNIIPQSISRRFRRFLDSHQVQLQVAILQTCRDQIDRCNVNPTVTVFSVESYTIVFNLVTCTHDQTTMKSSHLVQSDHTET